MSARALLRAAVLILPALFCVPDTALAQNCDATFNRFADELDRLADSYDKLANEKRSLAEVCAFTRSNGIPLYRRILGEMEGLAGRCTNGPAALQMAQRQLAEALEDERKQCGGGAGR